MTRGEASEVLLPHEVLSLYPQHDYTLDEFLKSRVDARPAFSAVAFGDRDWTYEEFQDRIEYVSEVLMRYGIGHGQRVAIAALNSDWYVAIFLAIARLGAIAVPINPDLTVEEARYIFEHAEVAGIFCEPNFLTKAQSIQVRSGSQAWTIVVDVVANTLEELDGESFTKIGRSTLLDVQPDDTCLILYTSGTTGFPKGVMHSQRSFILAAEGFVERMFLQPSDRLLIILPLFHINALFYSLGGAIAAGGSMLLTPKFSASTFWQTVADGNVTEVNIIAAIGTILGRRSRSEFVPNHTLRKVYGAGMTNETMSLFSSEFHVEAMIEGYGLTEVPGVSNNPFDGQRRPGSIGLPSRHPDRHRSFSEMRIVGEDGIECPAEILGEIAVRSPIVMQGYFRDRDATEATFRDGWFLTGDLGYCDADGYYYFASRKKDIIRRRGENVSGAEIDRIVAAHPKILEAAAFAVPAELGEDEIMLAVVSNTGETIEPEEISAWCKTHLSTVKWPRYFLQLDSLPHTPSQRVAKYKLKQDASLRQRAVELR